MRDIAIQVAREAADNRHHVLREYLQNYLLFLLQKSKYSLSLYFVGGTALRFLFRTRRFSEDLDFSAAETWDTGQFPDLVGQLSARLHDAAYNFSMRKSMQKNVQSVQFRFPELLFEAGLTQRREQNLAIHLEIDSRPPRGAGGEKTVAGFYLPVLLQHYDLPSLLAGKIHALLTRPYTKGRDLYDLFWFRTQHKDMHPNLNMLNNALEQTGYSGELLNAADWLDVVREKISEMSWNQVERDVLPFLQYSDDLLTFTRENLLGLLTLAE